MLEAWLKTKPPGMHFHREPVRFLQNYTNFQPLYFALEAMDQVDAMQQKVFNAFHLQHLRLDKPDDIAAFMKAERRGSGALHVACSTRSARARRCSRPTS